MQTAKMERILRIIASLYDGYRKPAVTQVQEEHRDPFKVLVSTMLSLRTRDAVTAEASAALFARAGTARELAALPENELMAAVRRVNYFRTKALNIKKVAAIVATRGGVPDSLEGLLALPGVGRKTANLVLTLGFGAYGICVDTHVHRLTNRMGMVATRTPGETEFALRATLPRRWWLQINDLLVVWGQNVCLPRNPKCATCAVRDLCEGPVS